MKTSNAGTASIRLVTAFAAILGIGIFIGYTYGTSHRRRQPNTKA